MDEQQQPIQILVVLLPGSDELQLKASSPNTIMLLGMLERAKTVLQQAAAKPKPRIVVPEPIMNGGRPG